MCIAIAVAVHFSKGCGVAAAEIGAMSNGKLLSLTVEEGESSLF